jgi:hypothetical protein
VQWLPSLPTDNIYKLIAIFGLWLLAGLLAGLLYLSYLKFTIDRDTDTSLYISRMENDLNQITRRINSLNADKPQENKISWSAGFKDELAMLEKLQKHHQATIDEEKKSKAKPQDPIIDFIFSNDSLAKFVIVGYVTLTVVCNLFGFSLWYNKIQKPSEDQSVLDARIKEATLLKLQIEISQLQPMHQTIQQLFKLQHEMSISHKKKPTTS